MYYCLLYSITILLAYEKVIVIQIQVHGRDLFIYLFISINGQSPFTRIETYPKQNIIIGSSTEIKDFKGIQYNRTEFSVMSSILRLILIEFEINLEFELKIELEIEVKIILKIDFD